jgi:putative SbcD/Mre11-related phosphoesterase
MNLAFVDRALLLGDTLVLADLHVGRARTSSVEYPLGERGDLHERLTALLAEHDPETVVVAGDLLHAFDTVPRGTRETVTSLRNAAADAGAEFVVVRGNHDAQLDRVGVEGVDEHRVGDTVVCHGHRAPDADAARYVVGHEHPAITVEGRRHHCFLRGADQHRGAAVVVVPAFSRLAAGRAVNGLSTGDCLSPLIGDLEACRPVVLADGDPLEFPPLRELRPRL